MHTSTVSVLAASVAASEEASSLSSQQMFFLHHMVCIPCADMAVGDDVQRQSIQENLIKSILVSS